jgi:hypothetical protein
MGWEVFMRRYLAGILIVLGVAVLAVHAEDFWVKKDWKSWSKEDCRKMLEDSPWTRKWSEAQVSMGAALPSVSGTAQEGAAGDTNLEVHYFVQDRSAIPVREAYIRQLQIDGKYDKMDEAHKKSFDEQADGYLNRVYDDVVLIHVEYGSSVVPFARQLANYWKSIREDAIPVNVFLINQRGDHIPPIKFSSPKNGDYAFELIFPRMKGGEPIVQDGDKEFSIEFHHPAVGSQNAGNTNNPGNPNAATLGGERVLSEFKVDKMMWKGKLNY